MVSGGDFGWDDEIITQQIIQFGQRHRADEAEIGRLHRSRFPTDNLQPATRGQAVQIDQDVDLVVADATRGVLVGQRADAGEMIERRDDASADRAAVLGTGAIAVNFETAAVVAFEQFGDQIS
jgi:hypothetical protein